MNLNASFMQHVQMLTRYKAWANEKIFAMLKKLPYEELTATRATRFGNMLYTLNHVYVIDVVFQAHLIGKKHGYSSRNTLTHPPLAELEPAVLQLDQWYIKYADSLTVEALLHRIDFEFIGGGNGSMTCHEMLLHVVNHGTYHRGFVADMMYQAGVTPDATDLPVFLRDVPQVY